MKDIRTNTANDAARVLCLLLILTCMFSSCKKDETYAEQKEKERTAISSFLNRDVVIMDSYGDTLCNVGQINVITESQFEAQDSTTDVAKNEYVMFSNSGVYMQIVRPGTGERLKHGDSKRLACRFMEFNILADSLINSNQNISFANYPDVIDVTCSYGSFTASFNTTLYGTGAMYARYGTTAVPSGWLVPLSYIRVGRQTTDDEPIAKVRLIVPHSQGTSTASSGVYPCFYEMTLQELRN